MAFATFKSELPSTPLPPKKRSIWARPPPPLPASLKIPFRPLTSRDAYEVCPSLSLFSIHESEGPGLGGEGGARHPPPFPGGQKQFCPCLCEGVAGFRPATPSHEHGSCPLWGFKPAEAQGVFRCLAMESLTCIVLTWWSDIGRCWKSVPSQRCWKSCRKVSAVCRFFMPWVAPPDDRQQLSQLALSRWETWDYKTRSHPFTPAMYMSHNNAPYTPRNTPHIAQDTPHTTPHCTQYT